MVGDGGGVDHTKGGRAGVVVGCEVGGHVGAVGVEVEEVGVRTMALREGVRLRRGGSGV